MSFKLTVLPTFDHVTLLLFDETPPGVHFAYRTGKNIFLVQATSPKLSRYKAWSKQMGADYWVIMPWSREEIMQQVAYETRYSRNLLW